MLTLPRYGDAMEVNNQGHKPYVPGRNLPEVPFQQYSIDGHIKKEFLAYKSSSPDKSVSDDIKLANWSNMQQKMTAQNLDDMAFDLLVLKKMAVEEKEKISLVETKLGLLGHLLKDSTEMKEVVEKAANKTERRLAKLEELLTQTQEVKKKFPGVNPSVFALASQGHKRKETPKKQNKHHRSIFFSMLSISEDEKP